MTYLINSVFGLEEEESYENVLNTLRKCVACWCADDLYQGEKDFEALFQQCLENKDFGDIARVYKVDTYFKVSGAKVPCGLYSADKDTEFKLMRIL